MGDRFPGVRNRLTAALAASALALAACSVGGTQPSDTGASSGGQPPASVPAGEAEYTLVAAATGPLGGPTDEIYTGFVDAVAELTNGRVAIELHPNSELGGEREVLEQVQQGLIDMSLASDSPYSIFDPKWSIMSLPYIFASREEAYAFLDGDGGEILRQSMLANDIRILAYGENSMRQLSNNSRPITSIEEVKGLKVRVVESPPLKDWFESIGAVPAVIPFPELYPALQQGVVEGQDNGMSTAVLIKFHEVQKYFTDTNHVYSSIPIAINEAKWQELPADLQEALLEAAQRQAKAERDALINAEADAIGIIEEAGGRVDLLTDAQRAEFIESARPIWQKYAETVGEDFLDQTFEALGRDWR